MKKTTRVIIVLLALATLLAIYWPESNVWQAVNNNTIVKKAVDTVKNTDVADTLKEEADEALDEVEEAIEGILDEVEEAVEGNEVAENALEAVEDAVEDAIDWAEEKLEEVTGDSAEEEEVAEVAIVHDGYLEYNEEQATAALAEGKKVALFFHAGRCGTCKALDANILEGEDAIENDTVIYKLDYDAEDKLKEKYGVTKQHTVVYLNDKMEATSVKQWLISLEEVVANFN